MRREAAPARAAWPRRLVALARGCGGQRAARCASASSSTASASTGRCTTAELSGAQLPLIERGARRRGGGARRRHRPRARSPAGGSSSCPAAPRSLEFSTLDARRLRRLAEHEHVDAVVAGGHRARRDRPARRRRTLSRRHVPRRRPRAARGHAPPPGAQPLPLRGRLRPGRRGARRPTRTATLGWRRAAIVLADWDAGWAQRDAFVAEFCALGGRVDEPGRPSSLRPDRAATCDAAAARRRRRRRLRAPFFGPAGVPRRGSRGAWAIRRAGSSSGPASIGRPGPAAPRRPAARTASTGSSDRTRRCMRAYLRALRGAHSRASPATRSRRRAGDRVPRRRGGDRSRARARRRGPRAAARRSSRAWRPDAARRPGRLDENRQAVVSPTLVRIGRPRRPPPSSIGELPAVSTSRSAGLLPALAAPRDEPLPARVAAALGA